MRGSTFTFVTFCLTLGLTATAVEACMGCTPSQYAMIPGMTFIRPDMIALLPILSGTLERPFYGLAGHREATPTLAFSIQANLLAMLAGMGAMLVFGIGMSVSPIRGSMEWLLAPGLLAFVAIHATVKYAWFARVPTATGGRAGWWWFVLATLFSTITIATIPFWMSLLGTDTQRWAARVQGPQGLAILIVLVASFVTHVLPFFRYKRPPGGAIVARGFEVLPAAQEVAKPA